jgi:hypothetical protein
MRCIRLWHMRVPDNDRVRVYRSVLRERMNSGKHLDEYLSGIHRSSWWELLYTHLQQPSELFMMDNGCNVHLLVKGREPQHFSSTRFLIDEFHYRDQPTAVPDNPCLNLRRTSQPSGCNVAVHFYFAVKLEMEMSFDAGLLRGRPRISTAHPARQTLPRFEGKSSV